MRDVNHECEKTEDGLPNNSAAYRKTQLDPRERSRALFSIGVCINYHWFVLLYTWNPSTSFSFAVQRLNGFYIVYCYFRLCLLVLFIDSQFHESEIVIAGQICVFEMMIRSHCKTNSVIASQSQSIGCNEFIQSVQLVAVFMLPPEHRY